MTVSLIRLPIAKKLFFLLLMIPMMLNGEAGYRLLNRPHFIPDNYYIGDEVVCRVRIRVAEGFELTQNPEMELPDRPELVVRNLVISARADRVYDIDIHFVPFYPQLRIPSIALGDVELQEIVVNTFSTLDEGNMQFESLRPQLYLPYTREFVLIFIFLMLMIPILYLSASGKFKQLILNRLALKKRVRPYARINSLIRELGENAGVVSPRDFYIRLTHSLRYYLSETTDEDFYSITTGEIASGLKRIFSDRRIADSVQEIMMFADEIKFSGKRAARAHQRRDLVRLKRSISLIEKEMTEIRREQEEREALARKEKKRKHREDKL